MKQEEPTEKQTIFQQLVKIIRTIVHPFAVVFNKIIPPYEPRIEIDTKLVVGESVKEHAIIRHISEVQLVVGLLLVIIGIILRGIIQNGFMYFISILGIVLIFSAYEIEEIYVTSHRVMIRRVGMIERIFRVPSDEEHATSHLVSFQVGRAPVNIILVVISGIGFLVIFNDALPELSQFFVVVASTIILAFGLRINRRAVTLHLAGGLSIIMGVRKGVPKRIVSAIQKAIYEHEPTYMDEKPAKDLDAIYGSSVNNGSESKASQNTQGPLNEPSEGEKS